MLKHERFGEGVDFDYIRDLKLLYQVRDAAEKSKRIYRSFNLITKEGEPMPEPKGHILITKWHKVGEIADAFCSYGYELIYEKINMKADRRERRAELKRIAEQREKDDKESILELEQSTERYEKRKKEEKEAKKLKTRLMKFMNRSGKLKVPQNCNLYSNEICTPMVPIQVVS